ncbi:unnamed protein product [Withania somnifera]
MEPICGQAFGAKNHKLLHMTLIMSVSLLLLVSIPISFLWLYLKDYLVYLLPDLVITSFLCPLKAYLSTLNVKILIMLTSALGVAPHIPINMLLKVTKGLEGVSMAYWITDLLIMILLAIYVVVAENRKGRKWNEGGWWEQGFPDWIRLLILCGPCCLTTCLEWWCYEILVLLTGRLPNAKQAVGVIAILGADSPGPAYRAAYVSLGLSIVAGLCGGAVMAATRGIWRPLCSHDKGIIRGVKKIMLLMALIEVVNFPLAVCGTARPWLGMHANIRLLIGFTVGVVVCLDFLLVLIARIDDWVGEANKAHMLA